MSKRAKIILLVFVALILIIIFAKKDGGFKVIEITDGNTLKLGNGTIVHLIGISNTQESKKYLEDNVLNSCIELLPDHSAPFNTSSLSENQHIYAYVFSSANQLLHFNAEILRFGYADLLDAHLEDSLEVFTKYANIGRNSRGENITPIIPEEIDYEDDDIILPDPPSREERHARKHSAWYTNGNENLEMLDEACDYLCPYTKQFANGLAGKSQGNFNAGQICEIFDYCYNHWSYVNDPNGHEYLASASETIEGNLNGDCDDFAILMASCILAIGGDACVNTGHNPTGGHAFTEVDIASLGEQQVLSSIREHFPNQTINSLCTRRDGNHLWMNLDWWSSYPGGSYYDCSSSRDAYPCVGGEWSWEQLN